MLICSLVLIRPTRALFVDHLVVTVFNRNETSSQSFCNVFFLKTSDILKKFRANINDTDEFLLSFR